jgi:HAD superfamily hydrolase (TIGR01544 family)
MSNEQKILSGGFDQLLVVTDFDRTMTQAFVNGKSYALISTLVRENIFDEDYNEKARKSYAHYRPIEIDETLPLEYRVQKMAEWWERVAEVLIEKKLSESIIQLAIEKTQQQLRVGVAEFLTTLYQHQVPVIIFSANGLGTESIRLFLAKMKLDFSNIHIFGNEFIWDDDGVVIGHQRPLIHVLNKDFNLVKKSPLFTEIAERKNVIAIGDNIGDLDMVKNCDFAHLLKVGFLNEEIEKSRSAYQAAFDVVIENDGSFEYLNTLLKKLSEK